MNEQQQQQQQRRWVYEWMQSPPNPTWQLGAFLRHAPHVSMSLQITTATTVKSNQLVSKFLHLPEDLLKPNASVSVPVLQGSLGWTEFHANFAWKSSELTEMCQNGRRASDR